MNGGVFLGLNGIVIKSHGGTDPEGFAAAIEIGYSVARNRLLGENQPGPDGVPASPFDACAARRRDGCRVTGYVRSSSAAADTCPKRS